MNNNFNFQQLFEQLTDILASVVFFAFNIKGTDVPLVLVWLILGAIFFTVSLGFINIRGFTHAIKLLKGNKSSGANGEISPFQALTTALSGTVGTGNIAGVALAISLGGPGATFWMIIAGLLGMSTKFVECTLAVKYRQINADGSVSGGPMFYIKAAFDKCNLPVIGSILAIAFSIFVIFGSAGFVHVNQGFVQVETVTGFNNAWLFGAIYAALVALVIIGGIKSIAKVTSKLVPLMCAIYLFAAFAVMYVHFSEIPAAFTLIVSSAFTPEAGYGGFLGVLIQGFRRAAYSNEAGIGSSPIAHAAAQTKNPISQGFVGLLEPFIDTVVICTITALVIILTGAYQVDGLDGVQITSSAFASIFSWFPWVLMIALLLFGFSTVVSWSYYGLTGWRYIFGTSQQATAIYKVLFCLIVSIGAVPNIMAVFNFIDSMIFLMAVPNILALYMLLPEVRRDLALYWAKQKVSFKSAVAVTSDK